MNAGKFLFSFGACALAIARSCATGIWTQMPTDIGTPCDCMFLMTDGSVLVEQAAGTSYIPTTRWYRLRPDASGSYLNGTWSFDSNANQARLYFGSSVLADGRMIVCGAELNGSGTYVWNTSCELYDPKTSTWSVLLPPAGWANVGDTPSVLLPDGRFMICNIDHNHTGDKRTAIFDPITNTWSAGPNKNHVSHEESLTLLPENTVVTANCQDHPQSEKFLPAMNKWITCPNTVADVVASDGSDEVGPGLALPNGTAFYTGASGHTGIYHPGVHDYDGGSWSAGPDIPFDVFNFYGAKDAAACLLTNGKVLFTASTIDGTKEHYPPPTKFFEYDGSSIVFAPDISNSFGAYQSKLLQLPNGQVLCNLGDRQFFVYTPDGAPQNAWRPTIKYFPFYTYYQPIWPSNGRFAPGGSYDLAGTQLNGLSQCSAYGDDYNPSTNYPIVRLTSTSTGTVFYCRTHDHSTMGIATGSALVSTTVDIPSGIPNGTYNMEVVANGIPSLPTQIKVGQDIFYIPIYVIWHDWDGNPGPRRDLLVQFFSPGTERLIDQVLVRPDANGNYTTGTIANGLVDVRVKGSHWLGQRISNVYISPAGPPPPLHFSLLNGDINDDNTVDLGDYNELVGAFNSFPGDPNWNPFADLNGDLAVDLGDYNIIVGNFNSFGDD